MKICSIRGGGGGVKDLCDFIQKMWDSRIPNLIPALF